VENGVACDLAEGILSGVCFALSEMGVEGAGGGFYRRAALMVVLGGCGVGVMEQVTQGNRCDGGGMVFVTPGFGRQTECELCTCQDQNSRTQRLHK
jgi:predicted Rossmann-fold nucleotide-binding protein